MSEERNNQEAAVDGVDIDAASEALAMLSCPYYRGVGVCNQGCHVEPDCQTGEPQGGWVEQLRTACGVSGG